MPTVGRTVRAAAAQIDLTLGEIAANVERHVRWMERARAEGVELLVFPELSLTGYRLGARACELSLHVDDPVLAELTIGNMNTLSSRPELP